MVLSACLFYLKNKAALARQPDAMANFIDALTRSATANGKSLQGTALGINMDLMHLMFTNRKDAAWRNREIASKKNRLAKYEEQFKNQSQKPKFVELIKKEILRCDAQKRVKKS